MNVLVTGASGFLGSRVVTAIAARGHHVRALVRTSSTDTGSRWPGSVEIVQADLRSDADLMPAFEGIDVLVHLAATVAGDDDARWQGTVASTEKLLDAMKNTNTTRVVLASSFSVYDWTKVRPELTEDTPLEDDDIYDRDSYALAKLWQERLVRRYAEEHGWDLRVLRPGFIWGRGNEWQAGLGQQIGRHVVAIAPAACPPLSHVDNCADAFAAVTESETAVGATLNVVDGHDVSTWRYLADLQRGTGLKGVRLPLPYFVGIGLTHLARTVSNLLFGPGGRLPSILISRRFRARFRPVDCKPKKLCDVLEWSPPFSYAECLKRTYGSADLQSSRVS